MLYPSLPDDNDSVYTTTIYSTKDPPSPLSSTPANIQIDQSVPNFAAIIAGVGGGVGLLLLLVGVVWYVWARKAKRRTGTYLIRDRKFYPDRYNQTVTSNRHSEYNEIDPGPVVVQPPPIHPPPTPLPRYPSSLSSGPLSRQTSSYHNHIPSPVLHGNWAGVSPTDGMLEEALARQRIPYPSSPVQPPVDRYTVLPSRSISISNSPPLRFPLKPPPQLPHAFRSPSATHRRYHSHQSYHNRPNYQGHDLESDSYFTPIPTPHPSPQVQMRVARRYTVFVSPPISPPSFPIRSSQQRDLPVVKAAMTTVALKSHPSVVRSTFSSTDSLVAANFAITTKRMMITNPDSDVDPGTDTEPEGPSGSGSGGSPSSTDIIGFYGQDQDTSPTSSVLKDQDSPTVPLNPIPPISMRSS